MDRRHGNTIKLGLAALLVAILAAPVLAEPSGTLHFYTSMQLDAVDPLVKQFERLYPGVTVDVLYSGSVELEQRLWAEAEAGRVRADVVWAANPALFILMKERGLLARYESPHAAAVPDWLKDPDGYYIAGRVFTMGIGYNTRLVRPEDAPKSWKEFLKWGPRAAMASPLHSGTSFTALAAFVSNPDLGWAWFEEASRRGVQVLRGTGDVSRALTSGEFPVIKGVDYVIANLAAEGAPVAFIAPEEGVVAVASPLAITASSQNREAAEAFLDYIISREGQQFLVTQFFIPVRTDVSPPPGLPTADQIKALDVDYNWMAEVGPELRERFTEIFE
ncbi:MAG: ABC transporter substrate-binding protein [Limnochordales bacterium]|nr:hypothetical protein [Bacillota bacterium]REJ35123.1 MAG: hypothetical protein DIU82_07805 [Bacillota bacterium]